MRKLTDYWLATDVIVADQYIIVLPFSKHPVIYFQL